MAMQNKLGIWKYADEEEDEYWNYFVLKLSKY